MNIITGGCGFIGSHLLNKIGGVAYDNFSAINAKVPKKYDYIQADILEIDKLKSVMRRYDVIWHLAASSDIAVGNKVTDTDLKNNTVGTYNVIEAMRQCGARKIIFSSSATYYGKQDLDCVETMPPKPFSLYGASKVGGEALISAYANLFNIQAWIFRFGNVIGGSMGHGVIYDFIKKLSANPETLEIIGDGKQERPYFLVEDCIDGMITGTNYLPGTYNLAPNTYTTVEKVAQIVTEEMGLKNVEIVYSDSPAWDVPTVRLNTDKIQNRGWKPTHTSDEAVRIATRRLLNDIKS